MLGSQEGPRLELKAKVSGQGKWSLRWIDLSITSQAAFRDKSQDGLRNMEAEEGSSCFRGQS